MTFLHDMLAWLAGGDRHYMTLSHCMQGDVLWITLTVVLDLAVAAGYALIALHWWRNQHHLRNREARTALARMRNIFLFCGLCGYLFIPIKMVWPAWRLYDMFMIVLVVSTWRYAWNARDLKVVYRELGRSERLHGELTDLREQNHRRSRFLNAVSHDLRTPLHALSLQVQLAREALTSGDNVATQRALAVMEDCQQQAADLLDRFLELGRLDGHAEPVCPTEFDISDLARRIATELRPRAEAKGLDLRCRVPTEMTVRTDRQMVMRLLMNLLENAVTHTRDGSVEVVVAREGTGLRLEVSDTGPGIPPDVQEAIFDEFYQLANRAREVGKGFGLGLAIARRLALQLGGDIQLDSSTGQGATFVVLLPEVITDAERAGQLDAVAS